MKVWKEVEFDSAHRLPMHRGLCKNLHGHRYKLQAAFARYEDVLDYQSMVVDFGQIKDMLKSIVDLFDHSYICCESDPMAAAAETLGFRVCVLLPGLDGRQPTAELMAQEIWKNLERQCDGSTVKLVGLKLYETPTSWVELG